MAFGSIELTTISRAQDFSAIKQHEDNKGLIDQTNISQHVQKDTEQRAREVRQSDNADWHSQNPDAKEKGKGQYSGDGGKKKERQEPQEKVIAKGRGGFDIKI